MTGLELLRRPRLLKMALKRLIRESTDPAAKRLGHVQEALGHKDGCTTVLLDLSFGNGISSTRGHSSRGRQSTQILRKLQLQCGLLSLIRVGAHDGLKFLELLLDQQVRARLMFRMPDFHGHIT